MTRSLTFFFALLAASAFANAPAPRAVLTAHDVGVVRPVVSDARGNVHGIYDTVEGMMNWNGSRPTGYGAVPEYRPLSLSDNGDLGSASAWRGRWPDRSGLYWLGARYYDPVAGRFISCDPYGHDADPSLYAFADGDPVNRFDPDGRVGKATAGWAGEMVMGVAGLVNNTLGALGYSLASPFAPDWAYQNLGGYAEGFGNTVMGLGQTVYDVGAFASYALISPFNNEFAYNNYGGSMERLGMVGTALSGGADNSGWYRAGYSMVSVGGLFMGGEFGQLGRVGRAGEITEMGVQAGMRERVLANIAESQAARASSRFEGFVGREAATQSGSPFGYYMQQANTLDVATAPNGAVFWSGPGNRTLAEQFALANGRTTLEMTPGGAWLDQQQLFNPALSPLTRDQARLVWSQASFRFSQGASGNAVGFVNGAGPQSLFNTVEYPALINNRNVVNVVTGGF